MTISEIDFSRAPGWYDVNAAAFAAASQPLDMKPIMDRFTRGLKPGAKILDLGCGAGRDARAFLERGFEVDAVDASREMCRRTDALTQGRARVRQARIEDMPAAGESWDGIWMMACLLHLPHTGWPRVIAALLGALRPGGRLYLSVKEGSGEMIDSRGRPMAHAGTGDIARLLTEPAPSGAVIEIWKSQTPASGGESQNWVNGLVILPDAE